MCECVSHGDRSLPTQRSNQPRAEASDEGGAGGGRNEDDMVHSAKMGGALKILERMVNQNAEDEIFQDFKYWEVRQTKTLLPMMVGYKYVPLYQHEDTCKDYFASKRCTRSYAPPRGAPSDWVSAVLISLDCKG